MSLMNQTSNIAIVQGTRVGPMLFRGAVNPVYEAEGTGGTVPAADAAPAPAPAADAAPPASVLYPDDPAPGDKPPVVEGDKPPAEPEKPADRKPAPTAEEAAAAEAAKEAAKVARKAELDAMTPEDRAKAEADDAAAEAEQTRIDTVPEDGKYDLKMPEGIVLDEALMAELGPAFKDLWLTNGQAQQLADKFIAVKTAEAAKANETWGNTVAGWVDTAKADPEIGGAKWDATAKSASGFIDRFGTPALKEYLNASGGGNHPELIRIMAKAGALIAEDKPIVPENPGGGIKPSAETVLYPNDKPKGA